MRAQVVDESPGEVATELLAAATFEGAPTAAARTLDELADGGLTAFGGPAGKLGAAAIVVNAQSKAKRVALGGLGPREDFDADALRTAAAAAARSARAHGSSMAWLVDPDLPLPLDEQVRLAVEGAVLGAYEPAQWRTGQADRSELDLVVIVGAAELSAEADRAAAGASWANRARDLVNTPPNIANPVYLADRAEEIASGSPHLSTESLGPEAIDALGMGALAAVAGASRNEPRLIVLRYEPPTPADPDVVLGLVGKAITFDTGGISLKPGLHMEDMKGDMGGGAAVLEAMGAIAELKIPVRAIAVIASAENMPGGGAYRPGDILTAANGMTIEVINTDAEGRLVLADALWYARREGATHVVDLATLTGAMVLALGDIYSGYYANDEDWAARIEAAGERSGDHAWRMPLHPRYRRYVDSSFADIKNVSDLREGSPCLAAEFLHDFAGDGPWAHIDIAGPSYLSRSRGDYLTQHGGTGYGVRLLVELASSYVT